MAIKKTAKMSASSKKVVAKKADPGKGFVATAKDNMKKIATTKYKGKPTSDSQKAAYYGAELRKANSDFDKASKNSKNTTPSQKAYLEKTDKRIMQMSDSTKKYTQKSLNQIRGKKP